MRALLLVLLALAAPVSAEDAWSAGRLEHPFLGPICSGVLVRSDVVLTAAHCARDGDELVFRPGDGRPGEVYKGTRVVMHPLFPASFFNFRLQIRYDFAVVRLEQPVPEGRATPVTIGEPAELGEKLFIVSWRDRGERLPRQKACDVVEGVVHGVVTLACRVRGGESGAPVFRKTETGLEIVAIISSRNQLVRQHIAQASNVRGRLAPMLNTLDQLP